MTRKSAKSLGEVLQELLKSYGLETKISRYRVIQLWPEIVGENINNVSKPERVVDSTLYVKVKSTTWRTELSFQKHDILKRIEEVVGKGVITDIRFK